VHSIGEIFVVTLATTSSSLTQGSQQATNDGSVGIEELKKSRFVVYSNPFYDVITVELNKEGDYKVEGFDVLGRRLDIPVVVTANQIKIDMKKYHQDYIS